MPLVGARNRELLREGVREDVQTADAVFDILSGDKAAGWQQIDSQALDAEENRVNTLTSQADRVLGVKFQPSAPKNRGMHAGYCHPDWSILALGSRRP